MIKVSKENSFSSCNACGGYNMQPNTNCKVKFKECGDVYKYYLQVANTGIEIRLCNMCAKELRDLLNKQIGEE